MAERNRRLSDDQEGDLASIWTNSLRFWVSGQVNIEYGQSTYDMIFPDLNSSFSLDSMF